MSQEDFIATGREALMAELLKDVDALLKRLEAVDASIAGKIDQATRDASGSALLATKLSFVSMVDEQERKLMQAGRHAAAMIGNELNRHAEQLTAASAQLAGHAWRNALFGLVMAVVAGAAGGLFVSWLAR